ncbi:hypothetical protein [Methylorubrum extorquens]|jgi:hypothetical protein|uniref:hypothetical protein n=1 Tax=Methylorubrum extorquens TaxID=408 RepID=UPI001EE5AABC|nr:hypothetical protein [Methylorubrum extorquens]MCG5248234.1 hypothetical protein [Methylorubrum extorquens]
MYRRDCGAAAFAVLAVWLLYAFTFWSMRRTFEEAGLLGPMAVIGAIVLLLNTAAIIAMIKHYSEDKSAIYGMDIFYLDQNYDIRNGEGAVK